MNVIRVEIELIIYTDVCTIHRYAKALHYKEQEFHEDKSAPVLEALILINNKLQQKEAAEGLLEFVMASRNAEEEPKV